MVQHLHTEYFQGTYLEVPVIITDQQTGARVNLTNASYVKWAASPNEESSSILSQSWPASGVLMTEAVSGLVTIALSGISSAAGTYYQEMKYKVGAQIVEARVGTLNIRSTII